MHRLQGRKPAAEPARKKEPALNESSPNATARSKINTSSRDHTDWPAMSILETLRNASHVLKKMNHGARARARELT